MPSKHITIKNHNLDIGIYGFTEVFFSPPSTIRIKEQYFNFVSIESLGVNSNKSVQKDVGNTLARGILGGVLLGPLGAIGGLMVGNNKITGSDEYIYKVHLAGGKFFIFSSTTPDIDFYSLTPEKEIQFNGSIESASDKDILYNGPERLRESFLAHSKLSHEQQVQLMGNIEQRVKEIVAEQLDHLGLNEDDIKNESSFVDDLGADSLDKVEIVMAFEEYLGCEIPDEDCERITTVQQAIDYVNVHINDTESASDKDTPSNGPVKLRESFLAHSKLSHEQQVQLMGNIDQRVKEIVAEQLELNEDDIKNESSFVDDLGADGFGMFEIRLRLKEYLGCEIPSEDYYVKITTVQQAIDYVNVHVNGTEIASDKVQSMGSIEQRVKKIVAEQLDHLGLNEDDIKNESSFVEDLGADEFDRIRIRWGLAEYLGCVTTSEDYYMKFTTVQQAIDYVSIKVHGKTETPQTQKASIVDELKKLAELRNSGIITEEEFLGLKIKLLNE